ncbi:MAG: UvrB/UvrC motif-containing protein, partial [Leuconostoc mesenteroides]
EIQMQYNTQHGITPKTIKKDIRDLISVTHAATEEKVVDLTKVAFNDLPKDEQQSIVDNMTSQMKAAAKALDFEEAAQLRDTVMELKTRANL